MQASRPHQWERHCHDNLRLVFYKLYALIAAHDEDVFDAVAPLKVRKGTAGPIPSANNERLLRVDFPVLERGHEGLVRARLAVTARPGEGLFSEDIAVARTGARAPRHRLHYSERVRRRVMTITHGPREKRVKR